MNIFFTAVFAVLLILKYLIYSPVANIFPDFYGQLNWGANYLFIIPFYLISIFLNYWGAFLAIFCLTSIVFILKSSFFITWKNEKLKGRSWVLFFLWIWPILGIQFFDINSNLLILCYLNFFLIFYFRRDWKVLIILFFLDIFLGIDIADKLAIIIWLLSIVSLFSLIDKLSRNLKILFLVYTALIPQYLSSFGPSLINLHRGNLLGENLAYSFCQSPSNGHIFASIPQCPSIGMGQLENHMDKKCQNGYIAEYDHKYKLIKKHFLFSSSFYGRLEKLVCLENSLLVAVSRLYEGKKFFLQNVFKYQLGETNKTDLLFEKTSAGNSFLFNDKKFYFASEWKEGLFSLNLREFIPEEVRIKGLKARGLYLDFQGYSTLRNSIFPFEFINNKIFEVGTDKLLKREIQAKNAGTWGVSVDEENNRLLISGYWGVQILDLKSGDIIKKFRTGLLPRAAVVDKVNNLIFIPTTIEGKIRVYDRNTLDLIKTIPVGFGTRYPGLSDNSSILFASSLKRHFYWDISKDFR